jgi:DNA-directed RNA polymerase specialized sigma24 family protein
VRRKGATPAELETLYRQRFEHFARVASAICGDRDRGRDAVQAAFTIAVRERRSFRGSGRLEGWVWRILVNEARRIAREPHDAPLETAREVSTNGKAEDPLGLGAWIATLPERQREALFSPLLRRPRVQRDRGSARNRGRHRLGDAQCGAPNPA